MPDGTFVIADARANRIWQTNGSTVWPFAGDGNPSGDPRFDSVPGLSSRFFGPTAVLPDAAGNVYVADTHNCVIRKVANDANRTVTTVAGAYFAGTWADGIGSAARLSYPMGMAWLDATHIVIADSSNHAIRVLDVTTRAVTTLAITHNGEDADGPPVYKLARDADVTVLLFVKQKVVKNFAFRAGELDDQKTAAVLKSVPEITGKK